MTYKVKLVVCWVCKSNRKTLYRVTPKVKGKHKSLKQEKNIDYVCVDHRLNGNPKIENSSFRYEERLTKKELVEQERKMLEELKKQKEAISKTQ